MIRSERRSSRAKVIEALANVMVMKGVPEHLRSGNVPEFVARDLRKWDMAVFGVRDARQHCRSNRRLDWQLHPGRGLAHGVGLD